MESQKEAAKTDLPEEELESIQGGTDVGYAAISGDGAACDRYFPAINQTITRQCKSCFYFHPMEQETGYCSR